MRPCPACACCSFRGRRPVSPSAPHTVLSLPPPSFHRTVPCQQDPSILRGARLQRHDRGAGACGLQALVGRGDHEIGGKKPEQKFLAELGMGDHFGELSVIADVPRQATVRTTSACLLVSISRAPFRNLMKVVPDVGTTVQSVSQA